MAEPHDVPDRPRDPDADAPQNPPQSVLNEQVRRRALLTYLPPIVLFFVGAAVLLAWWSAARPATEREVARDEPRTEGTAGREADGGTEGERGPGLDTPGAHNPDPTPSSPKEEIEHRGGGIITELGEILENAPRSPLGRRVAVKDVDVAQVDSGGLFWITDGSARVAVVAPDGSPAVRAGESVNVTGVVERASDNTMRIRASHIEAGNR